MNPAPELANHFEPAVLRRLDALLAAAGPEGTRRPYAVFDWDGTAIRHDTQEALFAEQIDGLHFRADADTFAALLHRGLPDGGLEATIVDADGRRVNLGALAADVAADYAELRGRAPSATPPAAREGGPAFEDFRAKLHGLTEGIATACGAPLAYRWIINFLQGFRPDEVAALSARAIDDHLARPCTELALASPPGHPGRAGPVRFTVRRGLAVSLAMRALIVALRERGVDVFVVTASFEETVRVFASSPRYGYRIPPGNVFGLRLATADGVYTTSAPAGWPVVWGPGKCEVIRREIAGDRGDPLLVAGDSDGDADMLSAFTGTGLGLIVGHRATPRIAALAGPPGRYFRIPAAGTEPPPSPQ